MIVAGLMIAFILSVIVLAFSNSKKVTDSKLETESEKLHADNFDGCYTRILGKDTATLKLIKQGTGYAGPLLHKRMYKTQVIEGGDVMLYKERIYLKGFQFVNKPPINYREIILLVDGGNLVEGNGDTEQRHDTLVFKYPANLEYDISNPLKRVDCR